MEFLCTICCAEKSTEERPLPARQRYLSTRISEIVTRSDETGRPLLILSGKYGLVRAEESIPWYDELLAADSAAALEPLVVAQLTRHRATHLVLVARAPSTPGWGPYIDLLERACKTAGVALSHQRYVPAGPMVS